MGAVHDVSAGYYGSTAAAPLSDLEASGHPGDKWGWAVGAGHQAQHPDDRTGRLLPGPGHLRRRCDAVRRRHQRAGSPVCSTGRQRRSASASTPMPCSAARRVPAPGARSGNGLQLTTAWSVLRVLRALLDAVPADVAVRLVPRRRVQRQRQRHDLRHRWCRRRSISLPARARRHAMQRLVPSWQHRFAVAVERHQGLLRRCRRDLLQAEHGIVERRLARSYTAARRQSRPASAPTADQDAVCGALALSIATSFLDDRVRSAC